ncbi:MAG: allophanate hydrolase [Pseudomonadota bacterium]
MRHTIAGLLAAYRQGDLSPSEVLSPFMSDPPTRDDPAWICRASTVCIQQQLDRLTGHSPATLPLYGIPFAVKDNIDVAGLLTTAACPAYAYTPTRSATAVERLLAAGAIVVGKTNLDQFATGLVGTRSPYGAPSCTFSADHVSGGSSSGSAVLVARGEVPFALGTDTAGSGRVPAGFNNLVGLKPTPGLVPTTGVVPACKTLDCVSIFALTAADAGRVLAVMEGPEPGAPVFNVVSLQPPRLPNRLRVGVPMAPEFFGDEAYAAAFEQSKPSWKDLRDVDGQPWPVQLVPVDMGPFMAVARLLYDGPWVAERYAAIRPFFDAQYEQLNPVVRSILEGAHQYDAADAFAGQYRLRELAATTLPIWSDIDVLMVPTAPTLPTHASVAADPIGCNAQLGTYTNFVNLLGLAALALPSGFTPAGLPFGITLIAPGGSDAALVDLGALWQQILNRSGPSPWDAGLGSPSAFDLSWPVAAQPQAEPMLLLSVVGAHLRGMPLHWQLTDRRARLVASTRTAPRYRLLALPGTVPPKPGLVRISADAPPQDGHAIEVEVYAVPQSSVGSFLAMIPPPLGLGSVELEDGSWVKGFICEPCGLDGAQEISHFAGWRAYMSSRSPS